MWFLIALGVLIALFVLYVLANLLFAVAVAFTKTDDISSEGKETEPSEDDAYMQRTFFGMWGDIVYERMIF